MVPSHWATTKPLLEVTDASKAEEEEDLNNNKEVLSPLITDLINRIVQVLKRNLY